MAGGAPEREHPAVGVPAADRLSSRLVSARATSTGDAIVGVVAAAVPVETCARRPWRLAQLGLEVRAGATRSTR